MGKKPGWSSAFLGVALLTATGCATVATPVTGLIITDVKWGGIVTSSHGTKQGQSCAKSMFGLIARGDASVEAAKKAGGITEVSSVDHTSKYTLVIGGLCTIVTGK